MTAIAADQSRRADAVHEHGWVTESSHQTSDGLVSYVRCAVCGVRRVDLQEPEVQSLRALTRDLG